MHYTVWNIREVNEFAFPINRKIRIIPSSIHPSIKHDVIFQGTKRLLIYWVSTTEYWHFVTQDFWRAKVGWDIFPLSDKRWLVFDIKTFVQIYQKRSQGCNHRHLLLALESHKSRNGQWRNFGEKIQVKNSNCLRVDMDSIVNLL